MYFFPAYVIITMLYKILKEMRERLMKKTNKKTDKKVSKLLEKKNLIYTIPIALVVILLPLIVRFGIYETGLDNVVWTNENAYSTDLYLYCKSIFFTALSGCMLVLLLIDYKHVIKKITSEKILWILFGGYLIFVLLSSFTSDYQLFAWKGSVGQFESALVLIGYIVTGLYLFIYCQEKEIAKKIPYFFLASSLVMGVIGLFQFMGKDLFATEFVQSLCIPQYVLEESGGIQFRFESNRVYLTLYNPNYAGIYCACLLVILFSLMLSEKKPALKAVYVLSMLGMGISLFGSGSKTGIIIAAVVMVIVLILHLRYILKYWYFALLGMVAVVACVFVGFKFNSVDLLQTFIDSIKPVKAEYRLSELYTDKNGIHFCYDDVSFFVVMEASDQGIAVGAACEDGTEITVTEVTDGSAHFMLSHEKLPDIPVTFMTYNNIICMSIALDGEDWIVTNQFGGTYLYLNNSGKWDIIRTPEKALFADYPTWITSRGDIWSKSIPLLKDSLLLGSGPDSFVMVYPNNDYLGEHNSGVKTEYTTRPHNWYLQMAIQTGVVSVLFMLAGFVIYLIRGTSLCVKNALQEEKKEERAYVEAFFLGSVAFMLMGLINDSSIGITPLFWCMFGMALAWMPKKIKTEKEG